MSKEIPVKKIKLLSQARKRRSKKLKWEQEQKQNKPEKNIIKMKLSCQA